MLRKAFYCTPMKSLLNYLILIFAELLSVELDGFDQIFKLFKCTVHFSKQCAVNYHGNIRKRFRSRDSNPGLLGLERERYLCAIATP